MQTKFISIKELFPRLYETIPGLIRGNFYCITGQTSTAKTKFAKFLFVNHAYSYCKKNGIPLKIIYFALEESAEKFWTTIKCDLLYEKYGETVTYLQIRGFHEGITDSIRLHLKEFDAVIEEMKKDIKVIDDVYNPTGCLMEVKKLMNTLGVMKETFLTDDAGNKFKSFDFEYFDNNTNVIIVHDHLGISVPEKNDYSDVSTVHASMGKFSEYAVKYFCKKFNAIVAVVQQQQMSGDNEINVQNNPDLLLPAISKLADNLIIARDFMIILGLFNPSRYKAFDKNYKGYNMEALKNKFRWLTVLKHRDGMDQMSTPLLFNGKINYFKELPLPTQTKELQEVYKQLN